MTRENHGTYCINVCKTLMYRYAVETLPEATSTPPTTTTARKILTVTIKEFTEPTSLDLITTLPDTTVTPSSTPTTVTIIPTDTIKDFTEQTTGDQTNKETEKVDIQSATSLQISAKATVEIIYVFTNHIRQQTSISIREPESTNTVLSTAMNTITLTTKTTKLANSGSIAIYISVSVISIVLIDVTAIVIVCRWR
ncbi:hepatitis A virus cellular receptor 1-like [Mercenaria mercenaria]|uniref:hepatitis A virus cellular receptor 1-like n=1 Tax=Mercenaria mercenaria TaxID=6596 RepID=UPI00234EAB6A|nr:hepatitis A virus cellular receptor 1-like [Mercenaria mercenaria]